METHEIGGFTFFSLWNVVQEYAWLVTERRGFGKTNSAVDSEILDVLGI